MARLPRSHPGIPYDLDRYLTPAEKIVFRTRLHWIRIVRPWLLFFAVLLLAGVLGAKIQQQQGDVRTILLVVVLGFLVFAFWRTFDWYREWFVGTDRRLMLAMGILTRKVAMIPLGK